MCSKPELFCGISSYVLGTFFCSLSGVTSAQSPAEVVRNSLCFAWAPVLHLSRRVLSLSSPWSKCFPGMFRCCRWFTGVPNLQSSAKFQVMLWICIGWVVLGLGPLATNVIYSCSDKYQIFQGKDWAPDKNHTMVVFYV